MLDQNNRWSLVAKKLSGKASEEEKLQLQAILDNDPYLDILMTDLSNLWATGNENGAADHPHHHTFSGKQQNGMH